MKLCICIFGNRVHIFSRKNIYQYTQYIHRYINNKIVVGINIFYRVFVYYTHVKMRHFTENLE